MTGDRIKKLRERLGWSQDRMAEYLGYEGDGKRASVSNVEGEKKGVSGPVKRLLLLLRAFGRRVLLLWEPKHQKRLRAFLKELEKGEKNGDNHKGADAGRETEDER